MSLRDSLGVVVGREGGVSSSPCGISLHLAFRAREVSEGGARQVVVGGGGSGMKINGPKKIINENKKRYGSEGKKTHLRVQLGIRGS
jgi:hypothetical protein